MTRTIAPVAALLFGCALLLMGNGLQAPFLAVRGHIEHFSTLSIGILGSSYFVGFALGCWLGPRVIARAGHIRTFAAMSALASAVPLVHGLVLMPAPWWAMRALSGFSLAVLFIVIESWLNERSTNETRGQILSVYLVINLLVTTLGQMMMTLYDPTGFALFALTSILVSLAVLPVSLSAAEAPAAVRSVRVRPWRLFEVSPVAFVGCLGVGLANGAFWSLAPIFAAGIGMGVPGIALFMSIAVLGGAAGQWPIGRLSDRGDRRVVVIAACLGAIVPAVAVALFASRLGGAIFAAGFAWGAFAMPLYAVAVAHANDYAAPDEFVELSSGLLLVYAAGAIVGPLVASGLMSHLGPGALFGYTLAVHAAVAAYSGWRMTRRAPAPLEEHVAFADVLAAAQTVSPTFDAEIQAQHAAEHAGPASAPDPGAPRPALP